MKALIYGCSQRIKDILEKNEIHIKYFDFTDSNPEKWNTELLPGRRILEPNDIHAETYDFCIIGSERFEDEILEECISRGFSESLIIPASFIVSLYERWNKVYFIDSWKTRAEKNGIHVIKNWYVQDSCLECIVQISDCLWNELDLVLASFLSDQFSICIEDMVTGIINKYTVACAEKITYRLNDNQELLKLRIENCIFDIPWVGINIGTSELHSALCCQKRAEPFLTAFEMMKKFYYYDEDYLAVKGFYGHGTILDIGANYGQSMYAFYQLTNSNIISLEVVPELYDILQTFKAGFDSEDRIKIINTGISDKAVELTWYDPGPLFSGSFDKKFIDERRLSVPVTCKRLLCDSLDNILGDLDDVWLIKMDIEGLEYKAILGADALIKRNFPVLCIEENMYSGEIVKALQDYYDLYYFSPAERKFISNDFLGVNYWLIPKVQFRKERIKIFLENLIFD